MPTDPSDTDPNQMTIPSRRALTDTSSSLTAPAAAQRRDLATRETPALLLQAFNGEIDLERELSARYSGMPLMTLVHTQATGTKTKRGVAAISTQDGASTMLVETDASSRAVHFTFTWGGMLGLRFSPAKLTDAERLRWIDLMKTQTGEPIYLWGQSRWENDYLIFCTRRHFTSIFAFSQAHSEAAIRITSDVTRALVDFLEKFWKPTPTEGTPAATW